LLEACLGLFSFLEDAGDPSCFNNNQMALQLRLFWRWVVCCAAGWLRAILQAVTM
jgi:hypothetical protein